MKHLFLFFILLFWTVNAIAACPDVTNSAGYVRTGASGANNGTDWTNAFTTLPAAAARGCTYYVAIGSYGSWTGTTANSGTTLVTVQSATVLAHGTATGWSNAFGGQSSWTDWTFNTDHWSMNGVTGGGPGSWGTGLGFQVAMPISGGQSHAIAPGGSGTRTDITLAHVDIAGRGRTYALGDTDLIYTLNNNITFWTIDHCYLHDTDRTMLLTWPNNGNTDIVIEYSYFARNGIQQHREAWSFCCETNVTIKYNLWEDIFGTGIWAGVNHVGNATNWLIYGNVVYWTGTFTDGVLDTGAIVIDQAGCPSNCIVAVNWTVVNNVLANFPPNSCGAACTTFFDMEATSGTNVCENNIWYHNNTGTANGASGCGTGWTTSDYNWFYNNSPTNNTSGSHDTVGSANPFQTSANANFPNGNWELVSQIAGFAIGSPYSTDMLGNGPDAGTTSRGALQFTSIAPIAPSLTPIFFSRNWPISLGLE